MKEGNSGEQLRRRLVASSLCEVVLSVYSAQEAAQLFHEKGAVKQGDCKQVTRLEPGVVRWELRYGGMPCQRCTDIQLQKWSSSA